MKLLKENKYLIILFTLISVQYVNAWQLGCTDGYCCDVPSCYADLIPVIGYIAFFIFSIIIIFCPIKNKKIFKFISIVVLAVIIILAVNILYSARLTECIKIEAVACGV